MPLDDILQLRISPEHRAMLREVATHLGIKRADFFRLVIQDAFAYLKEQDEQPTNSPPAGNHTERSQSMSLKNINARIVDLNILACEYKKLQVKLSPAGRKFYLSVLRKQLDEIRSEMKDGPKNRSVEISRDLERLLSPDGRKIELR